MREFLPVFEDESKVVVDKLFSVTKQQDGTASLRCLDDWPMITAYFAKREIEICVLMGNTP